MTVLPLQRDAQSAAFFDATAKGELLLRRCTVCRHWNAPGTITCARCGSTILTWERAAGFGQVASWAVVHPKPGRGEPTAVGIIELDEGPWLRGQLRVSAEALRIGLRVVAGYAAADGGEAIPVFYPAPESSRRDPTN